MSQNEWILQELKKRPLTPLDALMGCGCLRLAARILELKVAGHNIIAELVTDGKKKYSRYRLGKAK
jgi:hypothetical protein